MDLEYSSGLNGASFLLFELKQVVKLKLKGLSSKEIRDVVKSENVFQFTSAGRIRRVLPSLMIRLSVIDDVLAAFMIEGSVEDQKTLNLYTIMKTDRLFGEFMTEVIQEKFLHNDYILEKKDLNLFFTVKSEQSEKVAGWSESNISRLKTAYRTVLNESGIIRNYKSMELNRLLINEQLKNHLEYLGDSRYIKSMGG